MTWDGQDNNIQSVLIVSNCVMVIKLVFLWLIRVFLRNNKWKPNNIILNYLKLWQMAFENESANLLLSNLRFKKAEGLGLSEIQAELINLPILPKLPNFGLICLISLFCLILPKFKIN